LRFFIPDFRLGSLFGVIIATCAIAFVYPPKAIPSSLFAAVIFGVTVWAAGARRLTLRPVGTLLLSWRDGPLIWFNGLLTLFTALLVAITAIQVWAFIVSERAFLLEWTNFVSPSPLTAGQKLSFTINVQNTGRSSATIVDADTTVMLVKTELPEEPSYAGLNGSRLPSIVPTGLSFSGTTPVIKPDGSEITLSQDDVDKLNSGDLKFYVYGWMSYSDDFTVFGPVKHGFCGVFVPNRPAANDFVSCGRPKYTY
jgi:hypothetical protein